MSKNYSSKSALIISDYIQSKIMLQYKIHDDWHRINDFTFYVGFGSLVMFQSSFCFRMIQKTTNLLIDTGVLKFLTESISQEGFILKKPADKPKILSLDDLAFGFNIWMGFCCISLISLGLEILVLKLRIKCRKLMLGKFCKNAKIYPAKQNESKLVVKLKAETQKYFQVQKLISVRTDCKDCLTPYQMSMQNLILKKVDEESQSKKQLNAKVSKKLLNFDKVSENYSKSSSNLSCDTEQLKICIIDD